MSLPGDDALTKPARLYLDTNVLETLHALETGFTNLIVDASESFEQIAKLALAGPIEYNGLSFPIDPGLVSMEGVPCSAGEQSLWECLQLAPPCSPVNGWEPSGSLAVNN